MCKSTNPKLATTNRFRPLGEIEMPFYNSRLSSAWGFDMVFDALGSISENDPIVTSRLKKTRYGLVADMSDLPDAYRKGLIENQHTETVVNGTAKATAPDPTAQYRSIKIVYGRQGIKDFDFQ